MSKSKFAPLSARELAQVTGGAARVTAHAGGSSDQVTTMLTSITDSLKSLGQNNNQQDPMQMMMMVMMMGGMGGGGGQQQVAAAPPSPPPQPSINITNSVG